MAKLDQLRTAFAASYLLVTSCQSLSRISTCAEITDGTNAALSQIADVYGSEDQQLGADAYATISQLYRELDVHLGTIDLSKHRDLSSAVEAYRSSLRTMARETERYEQHLRELDAPEGTSAGAKSDASRTLSQSRRNIGKHRATYEVSVDRIEKLCAVR